MVLGAGPPGGRLPPSPAYLRELRPRLAPGEPIHLGLWEAGAATLQVAQARLDEAVLDLAAVRPGDRVLDAGCGVGATLVALGRRAPGVEAVGLDVDPAQLALARRSAAPPGTRWVPGDACALPFAAASFERVLAVECAFHFRSRAAFLAEAARVLAPGGRLVLTDLVGRGSPPPEPDAGRVREGLGPWPDLDGPAAGWDGLAREAGLRVLARRDWTRAALPSYAAMLGGEGALAGSHPVAALARLQRAGWLRLEAWVLERPARLAAAQ